MELSKQVVNLELSKKLKELGVKQESLFYWRDNDGYEEDTDFSIVMNLNKQITKCYYSAFTALEIFELLPTKNKLTIDSIADILICLIENNMMENKL